MRCATYDRINQEWLEATSKRGKAGRHQVLAYHAAHCPTCQAITRTWLVNFKAGRIGRHYPDLPEEDTCQPQSSPQNRS